MSALKWQMFTAVLCICSCATHVSKVRKAETAQIQSIERWRDSQIVRSLVVPAMMRKTSMHRFRSQRCVDVTERKCQQRWVDMAMARMRVRYPLANWPFMLDRCKAYPIRCTLPIFETWLRDSHNRMIERKSNQRLRETRRQSNIAAQEAAKRDAAVVDAWTDILTKPAIECTSTGNTTRCERVRVPKFGGQR